MTHSSTEVEELKIRGDAPLLVGTGSAVRQARSRGSYYRPATIMEVNFTRDNVLVRADDDLEGDTFGATLIAPMAVRAGDRVMLHYYPPHGVLVVGMLRGGYIPWQHVEADAAGAPGTFQGGWTNRAGETAPFDDDTYAFCAYRRVQGMVELRGRATRISGVNATIFVLPDGYRPRNNILIPTVFGPTTAVTLGIMQVNQTGEVWVVSLAPTGTVDSASNGFAQLDGMVYTIE